MGTLKRSHHQTNMDTKRLVLRLTGGMLAIMLFIVLAYLIGRRLETGGGALETRGDLTERFRNKQTITYDGKTYQTRSGITTVLMMGIDTASDRQLPSMGARNGGQADFLLLQVIDHEKKTVTPIQIDRDTMAEITVLGILGNVSGTRRTQICLSHGFGDGGEQSCLFTADAVSKLLLGVPVDFYIAMDMEGISVLNDAVDGVTVTLQDDFTSLDPAMAKGATLTLRGEQAEYFVRQRMNVGIGTNEARMARQRQYLDSLSDKVSVQISQNANFVGDLFDLLADNLQSNMARGRMINEAWGGKGYQREAIIRPAGEYIVGADGFMEFHAEQSALETLVLSLFYEPVS